LTTIAFKRPTSPLHGQGYIRAHAASSDPAGESTSRDILPPTAAERSRPAFFELPGEIRNMIYREVLDIKKDPDMRLHLSILQVSRQAFAETEHLPWEVNQFMTFPSMSAAICLLKRASPRLVPPVHGFRIVSDYIDTNSAASQSQLSQLSAFCLALNLCLIPLRLMARPNPFGLPSEPGSIALKKDGYLILAIRVEPIEPDEQRMIREGLQPDVAYAEARVQHLLPDIIWGVTWGHGFNLEVAMRENRCLSRPVTTRLEDALLNQRRVLSRGQEDSTGLLQDVQWLELMFVAPY
jgi:hypothetical protein